MTDKKPTDNDIVKALECEATKKVCIHEVYEPACGIWCKHLHKWCADMSARSDKNNCSAFKPIESTKMAKAILDLINRQKAEIERYEKEHNEKFNKWEILDNRTKQRYAELYEEAKSIVRAETIKEFEKLLIDNLIHETYSRDFLIVLIKEFAKRMVGKD